MNNISTGLIIKSLREKSGLTQSKFAQMFNVSDKSVSKWETGKAIPDISILENIAEKFNISLDYLISGEIIPNINKSANIKKSNFYVCPVCQNIIFSTGDLNLFCCGKSLKKEKIQNVSDEHIPKISVIDDELYISLNHDMNKQHYISFMSIVNFDRCETVKLYPESCAEARFKFCKSADLYIYCTRHGLFKMKF